MHSEVHKCSHLGRFQVDENVMVIVNGMRISIGVATSALEIFATDETTVRVDVRERNRTNFFEVKVKICSIDLSVRMSS